ncbi:MAG: hypothetical protein LCH96_06785 [Actinobacteria bacterium]|nr:hypothetical protein [Actinomycetota bacterium]
MTPLLIPLHGLGARQDLPLPLSWAIAGAVAVLLISFGVLALAWREPRWRGVADGRRLPQLARVADTRSTRLAMAAAGLFVFVWVGMALWFGQDRVTNPVFGFTYVWLWVGLVPVSLLFGAVWRMLNPLRTLLLIGTRLGLPGRGFIPLKGQTWRRLGTYPAAVGLVAFTWLELVQPDNNTLGVLRWWWVAWVVVVLGGGVLFGGRWVAACDPFEAYARLVSRASAWQGVDGRLALVNPLRNLSTSTSPAGTWAVVTALLGGTAFDGFTGTSWWVRAVQSSTIPRPVWGTLGQLAMLVLVGATFALGVRGLGRLRGSRHLDLLAASVIPIVIGYAFAHYLSLLVLEGQRTLINLSDPLGLGWNVFGTAELGIAQLWLDTPAITAVIQLAAIIGGHVVGVLVAHELSVRVLPARRRVLGQVPLLLVMIGYTCGGLLLLFSP